MATTIIVNSPSDEEIPSRNEREQTSLPNTPIIYKSLPQSIRKSVEMDRRHRLPHARSASDFLNINQSSIDTTDDDLYDHYETVTTTTTTTNSSQKHSLIVSQDRQTPSELRLIVMPDAPRRRLHEQANPLSLSTQNDELLRSDPSLLDSKASKQSRTEQLRRHILERRIGRRIHSTFSSSSSTLRSLSRRLPLQNMSPRVNRQQPFYLPRNSKWHFVRNHLSDIAMMSESYARMRLIERDLRWIHLRELIRQQVLEMREMSVLRQQYDGTLKISPKSALEIKAIPLNEVVHVERDGRVYSISTRDLVLGRSINDEDVQLDTFAQLDARRKFQTKQSLLKQQEGRTRIMFAAMFIFAMKTLMELRTKNFP
ncbi:unnamed protein product [Adineta ricciae]|uniref:Uncharacterized protein n=1 Tax=Adineta ricciae TaxID=249248 RepID=A0A814NKS9_ADIRI|nr:unnamed protein product [Adineta ricciae]